VADLSASVSAMQASWQHLRPWMPWALTRPTAESQRPWLVDAQEQWNSRDAFQFAMLAPTADTVVGSCGLMRRIDPEGLEIGYWLHVDRVGHGLMTNAAAALTRAGLQIASIDHIEIHCDAANAASAAVPARLGYTHVETRATAITAPGQCGQQEVWRLCADQWASSKACEIWRAQN
jgi:RimJ/RimL family protein N-acetyltransferase